MRDFIRNLILLGAIAIFLFLIAPDIMRQMIELFNGLGILMIFLLMILMSALPHGSRNRRR